MSNPLSTTFTEKLLPLLLHVKSDVMTIDGHSLTTSDLQIISSTRVSVRATLASLQDVQRSRNAFNDVLTSGATIYGVNTGFGGSAVARTSNHEELQVALIQMLNSASYTSAVPSPEEELYLYRKPPSDDFQVGDNDSVNMPVKWVRAAMLVRANTLLRGHSGATKEAVRGLIKLLESGITPVIPLQGSISASGDLTPLSFVVSALQGNPSTKVYDQYNLHATTKIVPADEALRRIELRPLVCAPKEALAIVNGTAFSDAVGGLAVNDAMLLAALAQMMTAMGVEAMSGHVESFDAYIAEVKGDSQQGEIARNIRGLLVGSKLAKGLHLPSIDQKDAKEATIVGTIIGRNQELAQDRYALRTSAQWLSPPTQDILLAFTQMQQCLNSTTDNPIVDGRDPLNPRIINGGNFQGSATASAMDKTRIALQLIGKLMFAQCTEAINPATNNGLPANLAATDPSIDFACKGIDINVAAYQSELGWLANPIGPHVQSAEMGNQAVNSLALISARKTKEAVSILQKLTASYLYVLCQAVDVRVMQDKFFQQAEARLEEMAVDVFAVGTFRDRSPQQVHGIRETAGTLWSAVKASWDSSGTYDLVDRVDKAVASASPVLLSLLVKIVEPYTAAKIEKWQIMAKETLTEVYNRVRTVHFETYHFDTPEYLGKHTAAMYTFIRHYLSVPMFQGLADNPTRENGKKAIGGYVGIIETALKGNKVMEVLGKAMKDIAGVDVVGAGKEVIEPVRNGAH